MIDSHAFSFHLVNLNTLNKSNWLYYFDLCKFLLFSHIDISQYFFKTTSEFSSLTCTQKAYTIKLIQDIGKSWTPASNSFIQT